MAPSARAHHRSHSLLLLQKLLNLRDNASPLTLVLDSLEQGAGPVVREFCFRAKAARAKIVLISFATVKKPACVDVVVKARRKSLQSLQAEIVSQYAPLPGHSSSAGKAVAAQKVLVLIDSLNLLACAESPHLAAFLSGLLGSNISIVAVYHTDVPVILPKSSSEYEPQPLTVLSYLATAIIRVSSLHQAVGRQKARNRSLQEPEWGLKEGKEGVVVGLNPDRGSRAGLGLVVEMELRRRSGRAVTETFVMVEGPRVEGEAAPPAPGKAASAAGASKLSLLSDHPMFASPDPDDGRAQGGKDDGSAGGGGDEGVETTFSLGLTEKQRKDREGVVLPYFDAQTDIGAGEGGRILYDMGREDDFDDEEDEI